MPTADFEKWSPPEELANAILCLQAMRPSGRHRRVASVSGRV